MTEHNYLTPHRKATYQITALNEPPAHILHEVPTGVSYEEVTEELENHCSNHHLEAALHSQQKRTQLVGESLQEFASTTNHLAHHAHFELPEHLISEEAAHVFVDGLSQRDIRWQLLFGRGARRHSERPSIRH